MDILTGWQEAGLRARATIASYWTSFIAIVVMSGLHLRWLLRSAHAGDVLSAYGAGLVVLGVLVGSRPYLRSGIGNMVARSLPSGGGVFPRTREQAAAARKRIEEARPEVTRDVWAERVIAVGVVVVGTLLNGWGTPLARRWGLPV